MLALILVTWAGEDLPHLSPTVELRADATWSMVSEASAEEEDPVSTAQAPPELHPATWPGFALMGLGLTTTTIGAARAIDAYNQGSQATQWDDYTIAANNYQNFIWATQLGLGITATGTVLTGTGLLLGAKKNKP